MIPSLPLSAILVLFLCHFVGDFIMQSDYMARNKSKSNWVLAQHVLLYCIPFMVFGWYFALMNACLHFAVDWVTSRMTAFFWEREEIHNFFSVIGFDQMIHMMFLTVTLYLIN